MLSKWLGREGKGREDCMIVKCICSRRMIVLYVLYTNYLTSYSGGGGGGGREEKGREGKGRVTKDMAREEEVRKGKVRLG